MGIKLSKMPGAMREAVVKALGGELPAAISELMTRSELFGNTKLEPEQRVSIEFADRLRALTKDGKLSCIWFHVPNEGKRSVIVALLLRAMGLLPGVLDYVFANGQGTSMIEFKVGSNGLSPFQGYFIQWARANGVRTAVCHSADEGINQLKEWGYLE